LYFWSHLGRNDQFGDPARVDNLSIHSALARFSTHLGELTLLWLTLGAVVVIAAMWHARGHFLRGEVVEAVLVVGASAAVVAPIAWPHYFTWLPLAAVWLLMTGGRQARFVGFGIIACYCLPLVASMAGNPTMSLVAPTMMVAVPVLVGLFGLPHRAPAPGHSAPASDQLTEARENPVS
jgi:alpha-1,2-mannosyltransferase